MFLNKHGVLVVDKYGKYDKYISSFGYILPELHL